MECMERFNKESLNRLLPWLKPVDVLQLRACCKRLNHLIVNAQYYWYYQMKLSNGNFNIDTHGMKRIHCKKFTRNCISARGYCRPNWNEIYQFLLNRNPEIESQYMETLAKQPPNIQERYRQEYAKRIICERHIYSVPARFCGRIDHFKWIIDPQGVLDLQTPEFKEKNDPAKYGLFMYQYLFKSYKRMRSKYSGHSKDKIESEIRQKKDKLLLMEQEVNSMKSDIDALEMKLKRGSSDENNVFFRKQVKKYHNDPIVRAAQGLVAKGTHKKGEKRKKGEKGEKKKRKVI